MLEELTKAIAYKFLEEFFSAQNPFVLFGTGTSCAVDTCFGMGALADYLLANFPKQRLGVHLHRQWDSVLSDLNRGSDLESAMNNVQDESLIKAIIESVATLVAPLDREYGLKIMSGEIKWPALPLFEHLVNGLPEGDPVLDVATTNYDLLAEYSFDKARIGYVNGFCGGIWRQLNWIQAKHSMTYQANIPTRRTRPVTKTKRHIRLYKVHGSLNTFRLGSAMVECNALSYGGYNGFERVMITPGVAKYELLHKYRSELLGEYDLAINKHNAFLFLGFGFNDSQLTNAAIRYKLKEQECKGVIITRDSNSNIENYLSMWPNLWLVCRNPDNYEHGSRVFNIRYKNWLSVEDKLWDFGVFSKTILGG